MGAELGCIWSVANTGPALKTAWPSPDSSAVSGFRFVTVVFVLIGTCHRSLQNQPAGIESKPAILMAVDLMTGLLVNAWDFFASVRVATSGFSRRVLIFHAHEFKMAKVQTTKN